MWPVKGVSAPDLNSIQGLLEIALLKLQPLRYPKIWLSSRTDGGVHALNTTAHLDLERSGPDVYCPINIVNTLNKFLIRNNQTVVINKCVRVPDDFDSRRQAISRTYLYRLAVVKKGVVLPATGILPLIPVEEWRRCHFINVPDFNVDKFREGASHLAGFHDFSTFKKADRIKHYKHNRRLLYSIVIQKGKSTLNSYSTNNSKEIFDYYDIYFHGYSFVHNQIRRMLAALIGVAEGKLTPKDIKVMLQVPSKHSWHSCLHNCPAHGLYLCNIEYNPKDLIFEPNTAVVEGSTETSKKTIL